MYNKNKNNQVMGYLCSSVSRNVEGFDNGELFDKFNRNTVKPKDDATFWKYLGAVSINSSDQDMAHSKLYLNVSSPFLGEIITGLNNIKKNINDINEDSLPLIFLFFKDNKSYVMRTTKFSANGDQLLIEASRSNGIHDDDFKVLKQIGDGIQLRVGVASTQDNSQRGNIPAIFNAEA
jgi:hypothetical protein